MVRFMLWRQQDLNPIMNQVFQGVVDGKQFSESTRSLAHFVLEDTRNEISFIKQVEPRGNAYEYVRIEIRNVTESCKVMYCWMLTNMSGSGSS